MQLEGAARYVASAFEIFKHNSEFNIYSLFFYLFMIFLIIFFSCPEQLYTSSCPSVGPSVLQVCEIGI